MFTGIIEGLGILRDSRSLGGGRRVTIEAEIDLADTRVGDSIAVNGVCLTAAMVSGRRFEADASPETLIRTTLGKLSQGSRVNLERALRFSDRLGGHLVTGHIDGTATVRSRKRVGNAEIFTFGLTAELAAYIVAKGSVAVDGVSLTVNHCGRDFFEVSIIPHTTSVTTIVSWQAGDTVNIETDIIGKYINHFLTVGRTEADNRDHGGSITREALLKAGFV